MMNTQLFGTFAITLDDGTVEQLATNKERVLLGYLAVHNRPLSRTHLAGLLWGNHPEHVAKRNLRNALARIKQRVPALVASGLLVITRTTVHFQQSADCTIDIQTFDCLWRRSHEAIWLPQLSPDAFANLTTLTEQYQGGFLSEVRVDDCDEMETWIALTREERQLQVISALQRLTDHHLVHHQYRRVEKYVHQQIKLERWHEPAHRQMIQLYRATGRHRMAQVQFDRLATMLRDTFHATPSRETVAALHWNPHN